MKLLIEKAIYGGNGLARAEGKAIFVPMTLPGETVEAAITRDKGSFAEASLVEVLEAAPDRIQAPCPYYGACGGCQYQHADYPAQLAMKRSILLETLSRGGLQALPEIRTHAGEPWGYRNRIRLHIDPDTHALGYRRRGSASLLPVATCPIAAPLLQQTIAALQEIATRQKLGAWCAGVELFTNNDESALLLSFAQRAEAASGHQRNVLDSVCPAVLALVPQLRGAGLFRASAARASSKARPAKKQRALADEPEGEEAAGSLVGSWGEQSLHYRVGEQGYEVALGAFFQGNRFLVDTLAELAAGTESGALAWDLYAGVGLFARALATRFTEVIAVEGAPISATALRRNLVAQRVVESSTLQFLVREANARRAAHRLPGRVVLDPPRAGLGIEGSTALASIRSPHITYVSCDPATLARDLRVLVDAGYTITQLHLVDMFPQTFHLETVAMLELR